MTKFMMCRKLKKKIKSKDNEEKVLVLLDIDTC